MGSGDTQEGPPFFYEDCFVLLPGVARPDSATALLPLAGYRAMTKTISTTTQTI